MDFINHAQIMIPVLTGLNVTVWDYDTQPLEYLEKHFCFLPAIQTLYTANGLLAFSQKKGEEHIYIIEDQLDTHAIIIKVEDQWLFLGPYVTEPWQDSRAKTRLVNCGGQDSAFFPYKVYYCGLPLFELEYTMRIAALILENTVGNIPPREISPIHVAAKNAAEQISRISEKFTDSEMVNKQYALEEKFEEAVHQGKTTFAINLLHEINRLNPGLRFKTNEINNRIISAAITRTIVRRAARLAGMAPIIIDAISIEYAQKMHLCTDGQQLETLLDDYIATFCAAIRANQNNDYSLHVKRAVQYINTHLSQSISVDSLCQLNNISRQYFVQLFKKETGKTVKQFVNQVRCDRAAELLGDSRLLIQDISHYVGYEDTSYFGRVFKNIMGVTPQEYREMKTFY